MPDPWEKEFAELQNYESGRADADAAAVAGDDPEPWINVIRTYEPAAFPAIDRLMGHSELRARIRGQVIDVGAGTCLLSARLSQLPEVERVYALDLSERYLTTTATRMLRRLGAEEHKLTFVASDFNDIPLEPASVDAAFLFAAIHHSLAPIKTVQEIGRILKPGGTLFILEHPRSVLRIRHWRRHSLSLSERVTEIAYTREELEYLFANAKVGPWVTHRWDVLSRPGPRRWLRRLVRMAGLEDFIAPPNYLWVITKTD